MAAIALDRVFDAVVRIDNGFAIKYASEHGLQWLGCNSIRDLPEHFLAMVEPSDAGRLKMVVADEPSHFAVDIRFLRNSAEVWINVRGYQLPDPTQYMLCIFDISAWKADNADFRHAAEHDDLTGLPNRAFLRHAVEQRIQTSRRPFSLALLDLDGFKKVNDTFGHAMGDAVLIETAKRLSKIIGPEDLFVRLGGDEFVIMLENKPAKVAANVLSSVLFAIARPYDTAPHSAYLGASIGVAEYPANGLDYSTLLKSADTAMYRAKNSGKNRISIFEESGDSVDFSMNSAIHYGIEEGEFLLEFQPQYDVTRKLIGAEALMRWNSRAFGRVSPDKFIPIVEEAGLMPYLGKWALRYSCYQLRQFQQLMPEFVVSVNVSPIQFGADDFDSMVLDTIREVGVDPSKVILEITESTLMGSQAKTERALIRMREQGIRFSIDDFGTGFSSLAYLTRLPVSSIKIDKSFVRSIGNANHVSENDKKVIMAMLNLAHSINLKVVAEGVETEDQFTFLKEGGCDVIQGYLLGRPMSANALLEELNACQKVVA